jgi:hypothetical protein
VATVAAPHPEAPGVARAWTLRAAQTVVLLGLLAAGILVAYVATRNPANGPVLLTNSGSAASPPPRAPAALDDRGVVERKLLELVVRSPSRLPRSLVDPSTGLARNNLQAVCRPSSAGEYRCVVRPALHKPGEGLIVRYGPSGFTWSPYRPG